jgi:hypothetical protein
LILDVSDIICNFNKVPFGIFVFLLLSIYRWNPTVFYKPFFLCFVFTHSAYFYHKVFDCAVFTFYSCNKISKILSVFLALVVLLSGFAFGRVSEQFTVNQAQTLIEARGLI